MEVKDLLGVGLLLAVLGIAVSYAINVVADVQEGMACPSGYTYTQNTSLPDGKCCLNSAVDDSCGIGNNSAFTLEGNATSSTSSALAKIPSKLGLIVTVIIAAVIIGILLRYLYLR